MRWSPEDVAELRRLWTLHGGGFRKIARAMGRSRGSISGKSRTLGLQFHGGRARILAPTAAAAWRGMTVFRSRVVPPDGAVLKSGDNQRKLGKVVKKGRWKGFPIFSLTLEERATCPQSCELWFSCYGNQMGHAKRYEHGAALEQSLSAELRALQRKHPQGFVVRLHILGDFMSVAYVDFWRRALEAWPALHIFGYTARQADDPIGAAIAHLRGTHWARFAIRTSGARTGPRTMVIDDEAPPGTILCPAQTGRTANCATCALCWATDKPIAFRRH